MTLIGREELQKILEQGLLHGLWSIEDFNHGAVRPVLPSLGFLREHPQFQEYGFRDHAAYAASSEYNRSRGII